MICAKSKFEIISTLKNKFGIRLLCEISDVSRSGYYAWTSRTSSDKNKLLKQNILDIYTKSKKVYGYRRIRIALKRLYNISVNHKKVRRLMKSLGIASVIRRKKFKYINPKNIDSGKVEPNILNRNFKTSKLDEKWVTDITYLYYGSTHKKAYLSAIMDLYNNEIVSYKLSTSSEAFSKEKGRDLSNLIIHSDQGYHYTSNIYKNALKEHNITQSMSRKGNCYDNACIESFFGDFKCELIYNEFFDSKESLFKAVEEYIHWYNYKRFQLVLKNHTPIEYRNVA